MTRRRWILVTLLAVAAGLRFALLTHRVPHHDEGVNGWMTEQILHRGYYTYDPDNYHGPLFFYLLAASRALLGFGLFSLRAVTALVGTLLCIAPLLIRRQLGASRALVAVALLAVSPTLVYYARDAIHETLFVALELIVMASVLQLASTRRPAWAYAGAAALAGMVATKETVVLFVAIAAVWIAGEAIAARAKVRVRAWLPVAAIATLVFAAIHVVVFTGAGQDPGALARSVRAYLLWAHTGTAQAGHAKPAVYYVALAWRYEAILVGLAAVGAVAGRRERVVRGFAIVGFGLFAGYSAIAYKMPWLPMSWLALLAVPAAHGAVVIARAVARRAGRGAVVALAAAAAIVPAAIAVRSSFLDPSSSREALAYVHTSADYDAWFGWIEAASARVGRDRVRIAIDDDVTWPLPWALLPYPHVRWGVATTDADVMVVAASRADAVDRTLARGYLRRSYDFRDSAEPIALYVRDGMFTGDDAARLAREGFVAVAPRVSRR